VLSQISDLILLGRPHSAHQDKKKEKHRPRGVGEHTIYHLQTPPMRQQRTDLSSSSDERSISESNLQFLSRIQNPSMNKLISALASDIPLDPIRIKQKLSLGVGPSLDTAHVRQELVDETSVSSSKKRVRRSISCNTDPDILSPQQQHSPDRITNLPTSYLGSLFSPSVFNSPSGTGQYFTFDHPDDVTPMIATPSPHSQRVMPETPSRFDEKELYKVLCETRFLESPRQPQLVPSLPQTPVRDEGNTSHPLSSCKKNASQSLDPEVGIGPDDFLALENWFNQPSNHPSLFEGGETMERAPRGQPRSSFYSSPESYDHSQSHSLSPTSHPYHEFSEQMAKPTPHGFNSTDPMDFSLPSIPNLPRVTPALSVVDLDHFLNSSQRSAPLAPLPLPPLPSPPLAPLIQLPSLPAIPFSIPMSLPLPMALSFSQQPTSEASTDLTTEIDSRDEVKSSDESSEASLPSSGAYALCKKLLKYFEKQSAEGESLASSVDPEGLAQILNIRARRVKELFSILDVVQVV
jgi:hypothetical protein